MFIHMVFGGLTALMLYGFFTWVLHRLVERICSPYAISEKLVSKLILMLPIYLGILLVGVPAYLIEARAELFLAGFLIAVVILFSHYLFSTYRSFRISTRDPEIDALILDCWLANQNYQDAMRR